MKNIIACLIGLISSCVTSFAQETKTDLYADNIVIVFDASGSMGDPIGNRDKSIKLLVAKNALKKIVTSLGDNTNVGLFVFGNNSNTNPVPIGPKNVETLSYAIDSIQSGGGTPLGEFIEKAANQLLQQRQKNLGYGRYKLLVVTDGEATDRNKMISVAPEVLKRNLSLDVVGVGMNNEHQLAKMSTSYRAANDAEALNKALQEIVAETIVTSSSHSDFDTIGFLSDEQSKAIIITLGNNENQPLFEKPKVVEIATPSTISSVDSSQNQATITPVENSPFPISFVIIVLVLFLMGIIAWIISSR